MCLQPILHPALRDSGPGKTEQYQADWYSGQYPSLRHQTCCQCLLSTLLLRFRQGHLTAFQAANAGRTWPCTSCCFAARRTLSRTSELLPLRSFSISQPSCKFPARAAGSLAQYDAVGLPAARVRRTCCLPGVPLRSVFRSVLLHCCRRRCCRDDSANAKGSVRPGKCTRPKRARGCRCEKSRAGVHQSKDDKEPQQHRDMHLGMQSHSQVSRGG
jgi:hypothetical protein